MHPFRAFSLCFRPVLCRFDRFDRFNRFDGFDGFDGFGGVSIVFRWSGFPFGESDGFGFPFGEFDGFGFAF